MVEFVTFFLTLTLGPRPVEVAVDAQVAAVELRLDGRIVTRIESPPWRTACDFGDRLVPHELEAVALDAAGQRLATARQWINYGGSEVEARLVLEPGAAGEPPRTARVLWQAIDRSAPRSFEAAFDGKAVPVAPGGRIELPRYEPTDPHVLEVELTFSKGRRAHAELSFGGTFGERLTSDLTAVPVILPAGSPVPEPAAMAGWFRKEGEPLKVFSVERDPALVLLVRDRNLPTPLPLPAAETIETRRALGLWSGNNAANTAPPGEGVLEEADTIRIISTTPEVVGDPPQQRSVFPIARFKQEPEPPRKLLRVAWELRPPENWSLKQRLFDALAAAGEAASRSGQRRAVLLLADPGSKDASAITARQAVEYLESLRVPLFVWTSTRIRGRSELAFLGEREEAFQDRQLIPVVDAAGEAVRNQAVVWLQGRHLPQHVELTRAAPAGARLAR